MKTLTVKNHIIKLSSLLILLITVLKAQEESSINPQFGLASLRGKVVESKTGKGIEGVFITVENSALFALTEMDGSFLIEKVPIGEVKLNLEISGFKSKEQIVTVPLKGLNTIFELTKSSQKVKKSVRRLSGQRVRKSRSRSSDVALLFKKRNSLVVQDAIGSEQIAKSGDSEAGGAAKRVTGTSLVGDNIFIRGMGERYVSVLLGDSLVSSPDPDKRVVPLDIFPTSVIDSLTIQKTYNPDQPGEFGSGSINIELKDYPEKRFFKVGLSLGFDLDTFGRKYFSYRGGMTDFLGYDDGVRALPDIGNQRLNNSRNEDTNDLAIQVRKFNQNWTINSNIDAFPNYGFSFAYGDYFDLKQNGKLGYLFSLSHKGEVDNLTRSDTLYDKNLSVAREYQFDRSTREADLNAFFTMTYVPFVSQKFKFTSFYSHKSTDRAQIEIGQAVLDNFRYRKDTFEFIQNDLVYLQLSGSHLHKKLNDSLLKWSAAYSLALHYRPDSRSAEYDDRQGDWRIGDPTDIQREYLENNEHSLHVKAEYQQPFKIWLDQIAKGYLGVGAWYKDRLVQERNFQYMISANVSNDIFAVDDPLEEILREENITGFSTSEDSRVFIVEGENDSYQGDLFIFNTFLKIDLPILKWLRFSGGLNYEYSKLNIYDYDVWTSTKGATPLRDDVLTEHNFLPAANFVFSPTKNLNLRLSYSRSVARPDFRESIPIQYNLNEGGQSVFGNIDLVQSDIHSADFRFELYPWQNDLISLSIFYKFIENPIEILQLAPANPDEFKYKYQNGDQAENLGVELEVRKLFERKKSLKKNKQMIEKSLISVNFSYIISKITVSDKPGAIYSQRDRPLQGQSPYIFNLLLSHGYDFKRKNKLFYGFDLSMAFNLVGPRIERVALRSDDGGAVPDVYEEPAPSLNVVFKNRFVFGEISLVFKNILDLPEKLVQGENEITSYRSGREISFKYNTQF